GAESSPVSYKQLVHDRIIWLLVLILTFGVISELAVGGWLVYYLEKVHRWDAIKASGMLSAFFICFTLGRLLLGFLTDKLGFTLSLIIFSGFSAICTFAAIFGGESAAF